MARAWFGSSVRCFHSERQTIARDMTDVDVGSGALLGRWFTSLFRQLPFTMYEPPKDQEIGDCYVRPGIERMSRSGRVMRREASVQRSHHRHHERVHYSTDRIGIRVAGVEESK